jgi:hypothetical protein
MGYVMQYWNQVAFAALGIVFGLAFPPSQFLRFAICFSCYIGALLLAVYTL